MLSKKHATANLEANFLGIIKKVRKFSKFICTAIISSSSTCKYTVAEGYTVNMGIKVAFRQKGTYQPQILFDELA